MEINVINSSSFSCPIYITKPSEKDVFTLLLAYLSFTTTVDYFASRKCYQNINTALLPPFPFLSLSHFHSKYLASFTKSVVGDVCFPCSKLCPPHTYLLRLRKLFLLLCRLALPLLSWYVDIYFAQFISPIPITHFHGP